jgi:hypothetical protein
VEQRESSCIGASPVRFIADSSLSDVIRDKDWNKDSSCNSDKVENEYGGRERRRNMNTSTAVDPTTVFLRGTFTLSVLLAVALAVLISIGLLRLYRRAVLKSMRTRANSQSNERVLTEASTPLGRPVRTRLDVSMLDHASSVPAGAVKESLYTNLLRAATTVCAEGIQRKDRNR